jgi:hypothetical protein
MALFLIWQRKKALFGGRTFSGLKLFTVALLFVLLLEGTQSVPGVI